MDGFINIWNADLIVKGQTLITLIVFLIMFMIWGKFRFCFISTLIFSYYIFFLKNSDLIERHISGIMGSAGAMIGGGAIFISLAIWSFFIDSD